MTAYTLTTIPQLIFVQQGETIDPRIVQRSNYPRMDNETWLQKQLDPDLTSVGLDQAKLTGIHLMGLLSKSDTSFYVWQSPLKGSQQTAEQFTGRLKSRWVISIEPLLQEYITTDIDVPTSLKEFGVVSLSWKEYFENVRQLVRKLRLQLLSMQPKEYLVVFGHLMTTSLALSIMCLGKLGEEEELIPVPITFSLPNGSITVASLNTHDPNGWTIHQVGSIAHIDRQRATGISTLLGTV